ncbi:hypothetical protein D3C85_149400 [compost metagenome]
MSKVYKYNEGEVEESKGLFALLIEGIRASSYARSKPTSPGWDFVMEPGIAVTRKLSVELDPNDPDPSGTCLFLKKASDDAIRKRAIEELILPDLQAMYAPDLDWHKALQKQIAEAMGLPARFLEPVKKIAGMGRYYSESIGTPWPGYYSFEET